MTLRLVVLALVTGLDMGFDFDCHVGKLVAAPENINCARGSPVSSYHTFVVLGDDLLNSTSRYQDSVFDPKTVMHATLLDPSSPCLL